MELLMSRSQQTYELGKRLRLARKSLRIQQAAAADALAVSRGTICGMENGTRKVGALELVALARLYNKPLDYFIASHATHGGHGSHGATATYAAATLVDADTAETAG